LIETVPNSVEIHLSSSSALLIIIPGVKKETLFDKREPYEKNGSIKQSKKQEVYKGRDKEGGFTIWRDRSLESKGRLLRNGGILWARSFPQCSRRMWRVLRSPI
jgi:hypothetical protein